MSVHWSVDLNTVGSGRMWNIIYIQVYFLCSGSVIGCLVGYKVGVILN